MTRALDTVGASRFRKGIDFSDADILGAREIQEDYSLFRASPSGVELLAVLSDGMGGHECGEVASKMAVDAFVATLNDYPAGSVLVKLGAALHQANNNLASGIKNAPALDGMGCTLVGVYIDIQGLQWISVGDSPLFLYRNRRLAESTFTQGIIGRIIRTSYSQEEKRQTVLQHSAAVNSGNSGGPLLDSCGRVIGVNTAKALGRIVGNAETGVAVDQADGIFYASHVSVLVESLKRQGVVALVTTTGCVPGGGLCCCRCR